MTNLIVPRSRYGLDLAHGVRGTLEVFDDRREITILADGASVLAMATWHVSSDGGLKLTLSGEATAALITALRKHRT